jgi:nitroreductase
MSPIKKIANRLSPDMKSKARDIYYKADIVLASFFSKSGFLASFYYCFFSSKFRREHRAVLLGRINYNRSLRDNGETSALLRRNIHRLEKGLIMRPRRKVFAEDYIGETVKCYANTLENCGSFSPEHKWANDVLTDYFSAVDTTARIDTVKTLFSEIRKESNTGRYVPYSHDKLPECPVDYDQLLTLFKRRRSVRWFLEKPVSEGLINQAVRAASLAPSACNRQPFQFHVANTPSKAVDIASCAMGTSGFSKNIPCTIAIVGDLSAYPAERDRHVIYIDGALAAMQLMLALETLGLSTCPINWPDIEERERMLSDKIGLSYHERPIMLLAVGYADPVGGIPYSQKKIEQELIKII